MENTLFFLCWFDVAPICFLISLRSWVQISWLRHGASNHVLGTDDGSYSSTKEVGFTHTKNIIMRCWGEKTTPSKQSFLRSCSWFAELLLESTYFPTFAPPRNHFATSGTDRTALMCDAGDRVALHAADSLTRIACERGRKHATTHEHVCRLPFVYANGCSVPFPAGCNQLMWKHIVCDHVTDRSHFIGSAASELQQLSLSTRRSVHHCSHHSIPAIASSSLLSVNPNSQLDSQHMGNL